MNWLIAACVTKALQEEAEAEGKENWAGALIAVIAIGFVVGLVGILLVASKM